MKYPSIFWIYVVAIAIMDINDLIRGWWFFTNWWSVLFWNAMLVSALVVIFDKERK